MRRTVPVIAATAGGLALLANFHTSNASTALGTSAAPTAAARAPSTTRGSTVPPSASVTSTTAPAGTRTIDGPVVSTFYGDVQVRVTLSGTKIVDVQALQLPVDRSRSASISHYAGPILRKEALQAQSANIDAVSGASYTSDGYAQSLQAALDRATR